MVGGEKEREGAGEKRKGRKETMEKKDLQAPPRVLWGSS